MIVPYYNVSLSWCPSPLWCGGVWCMVFPPRGVWCGATPATPTHNALPCLALPCLKMPCLASLDTAMLYPLFILYHIKIYDIT